MSMTELDFNDWTNRIGMGETDSCFRHLSFHLSVEFDGWAGKRSIGWVNWRAWEYGMGWNGILVISIE